MEKLKWIDEVSLRDNKLSFCHVAQSVYNISVETFTTK